MMKYNIWVKELSTNSTMIMCAIDLIKILIPFSFVVSRVLLGKIVDYIPFLLKPSN